MNAKTDAAALNWLFCFVWLLLLTGCGSGKSSSAGQAPSSGEPGQPPPTPPPITNTIAGGLTALPPAQQPGTNQIANSGFESGGSNWSLPTCFSIDSTQAHSGTHSLVFTAASSCGSPAVASTNLTLAKGAPLSYTLQGWVMTSAGSDITVKLSIHDATHNGDVAAETDAVSPGPTWKSVQRTNIDFLPIHVGDTLSIQFVVQGTTGMAWLDDVQLVPQQPLPISAYLLYPNYKGYLWGNGPQTIRLQVEVANPANMSVSASLQAEGGNTVNTVKQPAQTTQEIDFDGSSLSPGNYLINTTLLDANGNPVAVYSAYRVQKTDPSFQSTLVNYIDTDNFLVRQSQKHFVWGVYDRWSAHRCGAPGGVPCVSTNESTYLLIPGFNSLSTVGSYGDTLLNAEMNILPFAGVDASSSNDQLTPWLAALGTVGPAGGVGMGHLQIVNNWVTGNRARPAWAKSLTDPQMWQVLTSTQTGKPGGLGYYTYDEPLSDLIPTVYGQWPTLSSGDPGGVLFGTLARISQVFRWRDMADVMSADPYPVGNVPDLNDAAYGASLSPPMMRTSIWTREVVRQSYGSRAVWMVLEDFDANGQFPNFTQLRTQAYKAIINGATGILWWGFVSEKGLEYEWYVVGNQQSYFDFKQLSQEIMALEPILISPPRPDLVSSVSNSNVEYLVKAGTNPNETVILSSNFSDQPIGSVIFKVSSSSPQSTVTVYGENRTLPISGGSFTDNFNGYDVHVYIIQ